MSSCCGGPPDEGKGAPDGGEGEETTQLLEGGGALLTGLDWQGPSHGEATAWQTGSAAVFWWCTVPSVISPVPIS